MPDFVWIFQCSSLFPCVRFFSFIFCSTACCCYCLNGICVFNIVEYLFSLCYNKKSSKKWNAFFLLCRVQHWQWAIFLPHWFTHLVRLNTISKYYHFFRKNLRWVFAFYNLMGISLTITEQRARCSQMYLW